MRTLNNTNMNGGKNILLEKSFFILLWKTLRLNMHWNEVWHSLLTVAQQVGIVCSVCVPWVQISLPYTSHERIHGQNSIVDPTYFCRSEYYSIHDDFCFSFSFFFPNRIITNCWFIIIICDWNWKGTPSGDGQHHAVHNGSRVPGREAVVLHIRWRSCYP